MDRHEQQVTVSETREVVLTLPSDFPAGAAKVVVISQQEVPALDDGTLLDEWAAKLPPVPRISLEAMDRETIYPISDVTDVRRAVDSYDDPYGFCEPPEGFRREVVDGEALDVRIGFQILPCPGIAHSSGGSNCDRCWRHVWGLIAVADDMLDEVLARMQTPEAGAAARDLFKMTPTELGQASVKHAEKK